ncbi:MAG: AmmeMemoRadiSam system protein A [Terriglobales bacterium]
MCPLPDDSPSRLTHPAALNEFSPQERALLLQLAHQAIAAELEQQEISLTAPTAHLAEPRGVFTTLHYRGALRGCVGYVFPVASLYRTVAESARGAAFDDSRFAPVTPGEVAELEVSLSILSTPQPIQPEAVEIGRHGLLVKLGAYRGLLLPQVPVEHGWDRITFLEQTCKKAGLPSNAWQAGAQLEVFTAEVFGDRDMQP